MKTKLLLFSSLILAPLSQIIAQGAIQWQKSLGGSNSEQVGAIRQTTGGGYIIAGYSLSTNGDVKVNHGKSDYWIVKLNSTGALQWQKSLGGTGDDQANEIQQTKDGGYIIAGSSASNDGDVTGNHGNLDYWIVKLDSTGIIQWQKSLGGSDDDRAIAILQSTDGGYLVAGASASNDKNVSGNHGNEDFWIVKLDSTGIMQWQKSLGGSNGDFASAVQQTSDSGYIVAGLSASNDGDVSGNHGSIDFWLVKLDKAGTIQWQKSLGGSAADQATGILQTTEGGYIAAGLSSSTDGNVTGHHGSTPNEDSWIVKLDSTGNIQWQKSLGGSSDDDALDIQETTGGYIVAGYSLSTDGNVIGHHGITSNQDYWIVKLDMAGTIQWQKCLGGTADENGIDIEQTMDGGFIMAGNSNSTDADVTGNHGDFDYWIVKLDSKAGIEEPSAIDNSFLVYPNPANNKFNIAFSKGMSHVSVKIFDMLGKEVFNETVNDNQITLNLKWQPGIYFVKVTDNEKEYVQKLIVE